MGYTNSSTSNFFNTDVFTCAMSSLKNAFLNLSKIFRGVSFIFYFILSLKIAYKTGSTEQISILKVPNRAIFLGNIISAFFFRSPVGHCVVPEIPSTEYRL